MGVTQGGRAGDRGRRLSPGQEQGQPSAPERTVRGRLPTSAKTRFVFRLETGYNKLVNMSDLVLRQRKWAFCPLFSLLCRKMPQSVP